MAEANPSSPFEEPGVSSALFALKKQLLTGNTGGQFTLANLVGFSGEELDACYSVACQQLTMGQIEEASKLFLLLVLFRHSEGKYWRGFGICNHRKKQFQFANMFYSIALRLDADDVISRTFNAEVLLWMNQRIRARREAEQAIEDARRLQKREFVPYVKRAEAVLGSIVSDDSSATFER